MERVIKVDDTQFILELDKSVTVSFKMNREIRQKIKGNISDLIRSAISIPITVEDVKRAENLKGRVKEGFKVVSFRLQITKVEELDRLAKKMKVSRTDVILAKLAKVINNEIQQ